MVLPHRILLFRSEMGLIGIIADPFVAYLTEPICQVRVRISNTSVRYMDGPKRIAEFAMLMRKRRHRRAMTLCEPWDSDLLPDLRAHLKAVRQLLGIVAQEFNRIENDEQLAALFLAPDFFLDSGNGQNNAGVVPEPSTLLLYLTALAGLCLARIRLRYSQLRKT